MPTFKGVWYGARNFALLSLLVHTPRLLWQERTFTIISVPTKRTHHITLASGRLLSSAAGGHYEIHLVQPDALAIPAGRLPGATPVRLGGYSEHALRPPQGPLCLPRVLGPARVRRRAWLRWHWLQ